MVVAGLTVSVARGADRDAALAFVAARVPGLPPPPDEAIEVVTAASDAGLRAVAVVAGPARVIKRVAFLPGASAALARVLAELGARGVREACLQDHSGRTAEHDALIAGGFELVAETEVVRRDLSRPPRPERPWRFRGEAELGSDRLGELVREAMRGSRARHLPAGDPLEAFSTGVPAAFRERFWAAAELGGEPVGVALPWPRGERGVAMGFIGLVPAHRGRGLSADLLAAVLARLADAGAGHYLDEADVDDAATRRMLEMVGCQPITRRRTYRIAAPGGPS